MSQLKIKSLPLKLANSTEKFVTYYHPATSPFSATIFTIISVAN